MSNLKYIPGEGRQGADLLIIGEAPGEQEHIEGKPFVGKSGKLLEKMLAHMGLERKNTYITNVVKVLPEGNRTPTEEEIDSWKKLLYREIRTVSPKYILILGATAVKAMFGNAIKIGEVRGKLCDWEGITTVATYHPSYVLRNPKENSPKVKQDLQVLMDALK